MRVRLAALALALLALPLATAGCGSDSGPATSPTPTPTASGPRPSSPAHLSIVSPTDGTVTATRTIHVVVSLVDAHVIAQTTLQIQPDEGHVHLLLDGRVIFMQYALEQDVTLPGPGTHRLQAEFVAADHAPFNPRVFSNQVVFTVQ